MGGELQYVITLVHGTYARKAKWLSPDSDLSKTIVEEFSHKVEIIPFFWSGGNSPASRATAADRLREQLQSQVVKWPWAKHYIIAHSHGGNVALYALRDSKLENDISGLICLATPFLLLRPRPGSLTAIYKAACIWPLFTVPGLFLEHGSLWWIWIMIAMWGTMVISFVCWKRRGAILEQTLLPEVKKEKLLIVRAVGDEASGLLGATQFLGWAMASVMRLIIGASKTLYPSYRMMAEGTFRTYVREQMREEHLDMMRWFGILLSPVLAGSFLHTYFDTGDIVSLVVSLAYLACGARLLWGPKLVLPRKNDGTLFFDRATQLFAKLFLPFLKLLQPAMLAVCSLYCVPPVSVLVLISLIPLGPRLAFYSPYLEVMSEPTPAGEWSIYQLNSSDAAGDTACKMKQHRASWLAHSSLYDDPRAIAKILDWIRRPMQKA